jgi:hypothetical protein
MTKDELDRAAVLGLALAMGLRLKPEAGYEAGLLIAKLVATLRGMRPDAATGEETE